MARSKPLTNTHSHKQWVMTSQKKWRSTTEHSSYVHWDLPGEKLISFKTEEDFAQIAGAGLNFVR